MTVHTLYDKLWDEHVVRTEPDGTAILYIDRHLAREVTSPQAYEGLRLAGRKVWRIGSVVATADHNRPTDKSLKERGDHAASTMRAQNRAETGARQRLLQAKRSRFGSL